MRSFERLKAAVPSELAGALGVALLDPGQGSLAGDVFEPEVGVVGLSGRGWGFTGQHER